MIDLEFPDLSRRIETDRSGPFLLQIGVDADALVLPACRYRGTW